MRKLVTIAAALIVASPIATHAAGFDTPILYSAQHMGMGGAAIGYVDDPSAMFHNPAGLARSMGLSLMINATMILGSIRSAPDSSLGEQTSEDIFAVAPLIGVSYRAADWIAFGVAFYPVASAGAEYNYEKGGRPIFNSTSVTFLEFAPTLAFKLPGNINLGVSWRAIMVGLDRKLTDVPGFDVSMSGANLGGVRLGAQWDPIPELQLGIVYRNKTTTTIVDKAGLVLLDPKRRVETDFVLPSKLGFGARVKIEPVRFALDLEYAFQSQNRVSRYLADPPALFPVTNVFNWQDGITLRAGVEYAVEDRFFFRGGFIYDTQVGQQKYPTAFGTPPTSSSTMTAGFGMKCGDTWKFNVAVAHRLAQTTVDRGPSGERELCLACSFDGNYKLSMTGVYVDFMYSFADL